MAIQDLRAIMPGASALIQAICDELGVARIVDERVRWDERQCKLSPGTRIVAMIVNALVHRTPLYQVEEFYAGQDVTRLFDPGVSAQDLNDDALARALDALAEAEPRALFTQLALQAVLRDRIPVKTLHADTTSRWNQQVLEGRHSLLAGHNPEALIYVADSQLLTPANLKAIATQKLRFISRLPANYKLEAQLKEAAWPNLNS